MLASRVNSLGDYCGTEPHDTGKEPHPPPIRCIQSESRGRRWIVKKEVIANQIVIWGSLRLYYRIWHVININPICTRFVEEVARDVYEGRRPACSV